MNELQNFYKKLNKLSGTAQEEIHELGDIASSIPDFSGKIFQAIVQSFQNRQTTHEKKVALIYLMDNLLKSQKDVYLKLFETKITELFCEVYESSPKDAKRKLVLTYYSWEPYFASNIMKNIIFTIKRNTQENIEELLTIDDLNKLIDYYKKSGIDALFLEMKRDDLKKNLSSKSAIKKKIQNEPHQAPPINPMLRNPYGKPLNQPDYKIPKKSSDRDEHEVPIKKKLTQNSNNQMINMMDNPNDPRNHRERNSGYPSDNYYENNQQNMSYNYHNDNLEGGFSAGGGVDNDDDPRLKNISLKKNQRNDYSMNLPGNTTHGGPNPDHQTHNQPQTQLTHNNQQPSMGLQSGLDKNIFDLLNRIKTKDQRIPSDPRSHIESKHKADLIHHEKPQKNLEIMPSLSNRKSSEYIEQTPPLIFKSIFRMMKSGMFSDLMKKYEKKRESLADFAQKNIINIIDSLYKDIPYQCTSCGLRFNHSALLNKHLDWHFKANREFKNKKENMRPRQPLLSIDQWLRDEGNNRLEIVNEEKGKDEFIFENYVLSDGNEKKCTACGEIFNEIWDKDKESWVLDGAVKSKYENENDEEDPKSKKKKDNYELMHFKCYKLVLKSDS